MKKIFWLLGIAFILITLCIVYLIRTGVSLRPAPYIKPTVIQKDIIGEHVHLRLFSDWTQADYVFWQYNPESPTFNLEESTRIQILELLKNKTGRTFQNALSDHADDIQNCTKPCWINTRKAHQLSPNPKIPDFVKNQNFITISWFYFDREIEVPQSCVELKRMSEPCITPLLVHSLRKKLKKPDASYFFMQKYLDQDYFIFVENTALPEFQNPAPVSVL